MRPKKTEIVRKRTGCQRCRSKKRKCDEAQPECLACSRRGVPCMYPNRIRFKDVSGETAETSRKVEAARWSMLRSKDAIRGQASDTLARHSPVTHHREGESSPEEGLGLVFRDPLEESDAAASVQEAEADLRNIFDQPLGFLHIEEDANDEVMERAPPGLSPSMGAFPWPRTTTTTTFEALDFADMIVPGVPDLTRRLFPPQPLDSRDALTIWAAPGEEPPAWDDLLDLPQASRSQTPVASSALATRQWNATTTEETLLAIFETEISHQIALQIPFSQLFRTSSGLRAAALALATAHQRLHQPVTSAEMSSAKSTSGAQEGSAASFRCHYYDFAVADLAHQLQCPSQEAGDTLVGTCILLIYRDLTLGSFKDICGHVRQLETISSVIDLASYCTPALLRAWRLLSFDLSGHSLPTRKSVAGVFPLSSGPAWDSQTTIRDIYSSLWRLHCRTAMEASFSEPGAPSKPSASRRAVQWLCSVLGRRCDRRQWEQHDYHDETLSNEAILVQCDMYEERLGRWHRSLAEEDRPVPSLGEGADDIMSGGTFGAIVPFEIADRGKAIDYVLYLISRMICSHIQFSYRAQDSRHTPVFGTEALARIALGIILTLGLAHPSSAFGEPHILTLLYMVALLSEGTVIGNAILDGLLPAFRKSGFENNRPAETMERLIELIVRERHTGRSIRFVIDSHDEDQKALAFFTTRTRRVIAAFGDFNGRGRFRDVLSFDTGSHEGRRAVRC